MPFVMQEILRCGPLTASDGNGRQLFDAAEVVVWERRMTLLEGPSGSGKSTLLRQVAGLDAAPDAERRLSGQLFAARDLPRWRSKVTLLAQDGPVLPGTVQENLNFPYRLRHAGGRSFDETQACALLDAVGLEGIDFDRDASSLSGGERHRLCLVRGLLWDAPVLLADEPLAGLDEGVASHCFGLLAKYARRPGHAVVCVLHDPTLGREADSSLRIAGGGVVAS